MTFGYLPAVTLKKSVICMYLPLAPYIVRALNLRNDAATEGDSAEELLQLSKITVEEYFVAPPGKKKPLCINIYTCHFNDCLNFNL